MPNLLHSSFQAEATKLKVNILAPAFLNVLLQTYKTHLKISSGPKPAIALDAKSTRALHARPPPREDSHLQW